MSKNKKIIKVAWGEKLRIDRSHKGPRVRYIHENVMYSIVSINGVFHFEEDIPLSKCYCGKISFENEEIADLYAEYMDLKYDKDLRSYHSIDCRCYHLTSNYYY